MVQNKHFLWGFHSRMWFLLQYIPHIWSITKVLHLFFQTAHFRGPRVNVDDGFVFNFASSVSISQGVDGLLHV